MKHQTTSLDTIECPHCHKPFPITEALQYQFIEPLKNELKKETLEKEQSLKQWTEVLREREAEIEQKKDGIEKQVAARVQETTAQLKQEVRKETEATVALELNDMRAQLNEKTQKIDGNRSRTCADYATADRCAWLSEGTGSREGAGSPA